MMSGHSSMLSRVPAAEQVAPSPAALAEFASVNAALYRQQYEEMLARRNASAPAASSSVRLPFVLSWHWAAFIITVPWMFYRKMYSGGIILVALPVFLDHILPGSLFLGSGLLIAATAGFCGTSWYVEHVVGRFAKAQRNYPEGPSREAYMARARGVSFSAGIFGLLIQIVSATVIVLDLAPPHRF